MVEVQEIAVIFKRVNKAYTGCFEEFIPIKVVEGYYDDDENVFLDKQGNTYNHIAEQSFVGNVYAYRESIAKLITKYPNTTLKEIKEKLLEKAKNSKYGRDLSNDSFVYVYTNNTKKKLKDYDSEILYSMYEDIDEHFLKSEEIDDSDIPSKTFKEVSIKKEDISKKITTLRELEDGVKKTIKGQDEAIKGIVTMIWFYKKHCTDKKINMLVTGPTGSGKTAIFESIAKLLDVPYIIYGVPGLSQAGYVGGSTDDILVQLYYASNKDVSKAETGIIVLDEIDKLALKENGGYIATAAVQDELLKILEGTKRTVSIGRTGTSSFVIDTSKIMFIGVGAFSSVYESMKNPKALIGFNNDLNNNSLLQKCITEEQLRKYGFNPEIVRRFPRIFGLRELTKEDLIDIMLNSDESELQMVLDELSNMGVSVTGVDKIIDKIAEDAIKKKTGASGIMAIVNEIFSNILHDVMYDEGMYCEVILGDNIVEDNTDYELISKELVKTRKRIMNKYERIKRD